MSINLLQIILYFESHIAVRVAYIDTTGTGKCPVPPYIVRLQSPLLHGVVLPLESVLSNVHKWLVNG